MQDIFLAIIKKNISMEAFNWLQEKTELVKTESKSLQLNLTFSQLPRHTGKALVAYQEADLAQISEGLPGFSIEGWTVDRLCRVWLLTQIPAFDKDTYLKKINSLVIGAEMNELAAIYSALPFLSFPEEWIRLCEDGIRSNIGLVLEAVMYANPYPAAQLSENSFNQLVLKAFFTEKDVTRIVGLESRMNDRLADTLKDYVAERTAAGREIEPNIFKLIELRNQI